MSYRFIQKKVVPDLFLCRAVYDFQPLYGIFFKFFKGLAAVGDFFINEQNLTKE